MRAPAVTVEGFGFDPARGELWFAGDTAEAVLLEMEARRRSLADEADELTARAESAAQAADDAASRAAEAETAFTAVAHLRERSLDAELLRQLHGLAAALEQRLAAAVALAEGIESTRSARARRWCSALRRAERGATAPRRVRGGGAAGLCGRGRARPARRGHGCTPRRSPGDRHLRRGHRSRDARPRRREMRSRRPRLPRRPRAPPPTAPTAPTQPSPSEPHVVRRPTSTCSPGFSS